MQGVADKLIAENLIPKQLIPEHLAVHILLIFYGFFYEEESRACGFCNLPNCSAINSNNPAHCQLISLILFKLLYY